MDRSRYRNPDMPKGYVKQNPELKCAEGIEIDGVYYKWAKYIYDAHIELKEDFATLNDLILSSEDEVAENNEDKVDVNNDKDVIEAIKTNELNISSNKIKLEKNEEFGGKRKSSKNRKEDELNISPNKIKQEKNEDFGGKRKSSKNQKEDELNISSNKIKLEKNEEFSGKRKSSKNLKEDVSSPDTSLSKVDIDSGEHEKKKKDCKIGKSDSSSPTRRKHASSSSRRHRRHHSPMPTCRKVSPLSSRSHGKIVTYSSSPSPSPERFAEIKEEKYYKVEIKDECLEQPMHLFGSYQCEVCNITMTSLLTYNTHINGKKHRKNLKLQNVSEVVAQSIPSTVTSEDQSKYPKPPPNVIRRKVAERAKIQSVIEHNVKKPCPGLSRVTEIQGISETQYYCSLCDSVCSSSSIVPHLTGFKHHLTSVKKYNPDVYEDLANKPKYMIEKKIMSILRDVQKKKGMGHMRVEVDELTFNYSNDLIYDTSHSSNDHPRTSKETSRALSGSSSASRPNMSTSDFFCEICQSHMNSVQMWNAHIGGKRHLTNVKKNPGDLPSKTKTVLVPNRRAYLLDRLAAEVPGEPIVGLQEIRETEIPETYSHSYQCFLCGSCHTSMDIVDHVISLKHRQKYLDHIKYSGRNIVFGMKDNSSYNLVREMCEDVQAQEGSGMPAVHVNKNILRR